jgi:hypothetical protein
MSRKRTGYSGKDRQESAVTTVRRGEERATSVMVDRQSIAEAAYFKAEKRGFRPGCETQDWLEAEREMMRFSLNRANDSAPSRRG